MITEFKLIFEGKPDINIGRFQKSLPSNFQVVEEDDGIYLKVESALAEDQRCQYIVDREIDRHFYLTSVKIRAEMICKTVLSSLTVRYRIHGSLPDNISPQNWNYELAIQLRLWSIASDSTETTTKLILLFQIIELAYPDRSNYPKYTDFAKAPHPLTECKFIRHLVVHSGDVYSEQLKLYCAYIELPEIMLDITDSLYYKIIASKLPLMEAEAKKAIDTAL